MDIHKTNKLVLFYCLLMNIVACSVTSLPFDIKKSINQTESAISDGNSRLSNTKIIQKNNFISHSPTGYFGNQVIIQNDIDDLPPIFNNNIQMDKQFLGIRSIANGLTDLTKIPTVVDIYNHDQPMDSCNEVRLTQHEGNLIDLLNLISSRCDVGWAYRQGKLILADTDTRTWIVKNIPGDVQVQNQINTNTGVQSQSGSTSQAQSQQNTVQNISFNLQNSLWINLQDGIKNIISKLGKFNISPSTSSITVTDKPSVLLRVDRYMQNQNEIMSRQVHIDVQILSVDVDASDNYGINWGLALNSADAKFTINGTAVAAGDTTKTGGFIPSPVFVPTNTTQAFTIRSTSGDLNGSQLMINALSTISKTSIVTSTAVTTLSSQPVPVQFIDQMAYLASVATTQVSQVGSQTSLTPGQLTTGFSLNILPVIQADNSVYMQLSINLSALKKMAQYSTQGTSIQLPETLQRNLMQKAVVHSGDCFVVTGFDSDNQALINTGVGGAYNWIFGGGVNANKTRTRMVILVTPRVVNN